MVREGNDESSSRVGDGFPWLVTVASLAVGLWIFVSNGVDAYRERETLREIERQLEARHESSLDTINRARRRRRALPRSGDALMVEFDRHGWLPDEAVARMRGGEPK